MAKKFIKVTGLNKVFDVSTDGKTLDTTKLKTSISDTATDYSILYMVATSDDEQYGYKADTTYTWSRGILVSSNIDSANTWREVKVNGTSKIAANNSQALDVSAGKNVTLSYTNNKVVINATNTDEKTTESGHYTPSTEKTTYGDSYPDTETVISKIDVDSKGHIVGANEETNDPIIGGENILRCTQYPIVSDTNTDNSWNYGKFVMSNILLDLCGQSYETTRVESPASSNREYCDAIILKDKEHYGVCQTVTNIYLENLISNIERSLINLNSELIHGHTVKSIPFTFSFYAKMQDESIEKTSITYTPIIAQNEEILKQASETSSLTYSDGWKKFSITRHVDIETIKNNGNLLGLGFVGNESETPVLIACPSLTIGKYDIDWKPNPLDAKSDIVGVGNILRCSTFTSDAYQTYYCNITNIGSEDKVSSKYSAPQQLPGCESLNSVYALDIGLSDNTYGITYREPGALLANSGWHTALMNYVGNTDTEIPVSMSIWCLSTSEIEVALMPVSVKDYDLFAPLTYVEVPRNQWTRLTRTIYIPAGITNSSQVYLGSALATCNGTADVLFALPMVTLGSIPSTWFPSAWDLMYNTSCIDSTARSNAAAAQTTANSALSTANTAKSTASSAYTLANNASTAAKNAQTTADGKVSKSGDTMSGDLDMNNKNITNVYSLSTDNLYGTTDSTITIDADIVNMKCVLDMNENAINNVYKITASDTTNGIKITGGIDTTNAGFKVSGTAGTSSQLMQGDGKFRAIETTLTDSDNIPTSSAIKNLKIGGRNLLHGSQISSLSSNSYWFQGTFRASGSGSNTINTYTAGELPIPTITKSINLTCGSSATEYGFAQDKYKFPTTTYTGSGYAFYKGDKVCLSCWIKPSAAGVTARLQPIWDSKNESNSAGDITITLNAGWQHVYYSGTVDSDLLISNGISIGYVYCTTKGASIEVCCPKLEYGEIPTDWTPAPEDVGGTTDIIDTTGTYTYTDGDDFTYTVPDIQMTGRIKLCSPTKGDNCGGLIQFGDGDGARNLIGECSYTNGKWVPYDNDVLTIASQTLRLAGEDGSPYVQLFNSNDETSTTAQLVNYTPQNINLTTATSYNWALYSNYGAANNKYSLAHTATSLAITISSPSGCANYQYFMMRQSTNTCTVTLTTTSGYTVVTKGNVTSFTVAAGQTIEFCAIVVGTYIYVTYTLFG